MAYDIGHEEFMAHVSCQSVLTEIWTGHMKTSQNSSLKVRPDILAWAKKKFTLKKSSDENHLG